MIYISVSSRSNRPVTKMECWADTTNKTPRQWITRLSRLWTYQRCNRRQRTMKRTKWSRSRHDRCSNVCCTSRPVHVLISRMLSRRCSGFRRIQDSNIGRLLFAYCGTSSRQKTTASLTTVAPVRYKLKRTQTRTGKLLSMTDDQFRGK